MQSIWRSSGAVGVAASVLMAGLAVAQEAAAPVPIDIVMGAGELVPRCEPRELRLPAGTLVELRLDNRGTTALNFHAPAFLAPERVQGAGVPITEGGPLEGLVVGPGTTERVRMITPGEGRYPFACTRPAAAAPEPSGVIVVVPGPRG